MKKSTRICDNCKKETRNRFNELGWIKLGDDIRGKKFRIQITFQFEGANLSPRDIFVPAVLDFCSKECLIKYFIENIPNIKE